MKIKTIIKAIILYSLIAIINPISSIAQPSLKGTWCDGNDFVTFQKKTGKRTMLVGGNLHEGGACLTLEWRKDNRFKHIDKQYKNGWGLYEYYETKVKEILIEEFNNETYMLAFDAKGNVVGVLRRLNDNESVYSSIINELSIVALDGKYKDNKGNTVSIDGRNMTFEGLGNNKQKFTIPEGMYEYPEFNLIRLDNGKLYKYILKFGELLLTPVEIRIVKNQHKNTFSIDYDYYEKEGNMDEDPSKVIGDTIELSKSEDSDLGGYFPILNQRVIMPAIFSNLASSYSTRIELLDLILNEIIARHGFSFPDDPQMKSVFSGKKWYKPSINDMNAIQLTNTELINVNLLKKAINYSKENLKYE